MAEGGGLENRYTFAGIVSSNLTPSAKILRRNPINLRATRPECHAPCGRTAIWGAAASVGDEAAAGLTDLGCDPLEVSHTRCLGCVAAWQERHPVVKHRWFLGKV